MGEESVEDLREIGELLAYLKEPEPPKGMKDAFRKAAGSSNKFLNMAPKVIKSPPCQEAIRMARNRPWPISDSNLLADDAGPLITWPLGGHQRPEQGTGRISAFTACKSSAKTKSSCAGGASRRGFGFSGTGSWPIRANPFR